MPITVDNTGEVALVELRKWRGSGLPLYKARGDCLVR